MSQSLVSVVAEGIPITTLTIGYSARVRIQGRGTDGSIFVQSRFTVTAPMLLCRSNEVNGYQRSPLSLSLYIPLSSIRLAIAASCRITLERTPNCFSLFSPGHRDRFSIVERRGTPLRDTLWRRARLERYLSPIFDTGIRDR